ncbi:MAG: PadR family transcriptional regulator [Clostridia bacterium]
MSVNVISADMLRGNVDTFIMRVLMDGKKYGVEIKNEISQKTNNLYVPNEQTLYSAFHRLEEMGLIVGVWGNDYIGATRKYYEITEDGIKAYEQNKRKWNNAKKLIDILIG